MYRGGRETRKIVFRGKRGPFPPFLDKSLNMGNTGKQKNLSKLRYESFGRQAEILIPEY
jgi:hypothetical protein